MEGPTMSIKWTVMVYLGADNNLSVDFLWDLKEMQDVLEVGPEKEVTVVAQYDPGQGIPTQRYVINKGSAQARADAAKLPPPDGQDGWLILDHFEIPKLSEDLELKNIVNGFKAKGKEQKQRFKEYKNTLGGQKDPLNKNTGDPMTLLQFISWGINTYEAKRYMVVLAGHGSGAVEDFLLKDESSRDSLTLHELRDVFQLVQKKLGLRLEELKADAEKTRHSDQKLKQLRELLADKRDRLDILGMDSCLMSMAEVNYQLAGNVDYLVGAE